MLKKLGLAAMATMVIGAGTAQAGIISDTSPDGAKYQLDYSNSADKYTFTFTADFTGVTSSPPLNTYALAYSIATVPGNVDWTAGAITEGPGPDSNWSINQDVVTNSNGCPGGGAPSKDWCVGLKKDGTLEPTPITNTSVLKWVSTMTLSSGVPNFSDPLNPVSYKFVTTTGVFDQKKQEWVFGNYQISRTLGVPSVPDGGTTLMLLGTALVGLGILRRKVGS